MNPTRREFIILGGLLLAGCASDNGYNSSPAGKPAPTGGNCQQNGVVTNVQVTHTPNHELVIPAADVKAGVEKTYELTDNGSGHIQDVTGTAADFAKLQQG